MMEVRLLPECPCHGRHPAIYHFNPRYQGLVKQIHFAFTLHFPFLLFSFTYLLTWTAHFHCVPNHSSRSHVVETICLYFLELVTGSIPFLDARILITFLQGSHAFVIYILHLKMKHNHLFLPEACLGNRHGPLLVL